MISELQERFRIWRIFNDLSLDAAAVAVVWHWAFSHALGVVDTTVSMVVLGLSVWLVYLGDRWLDVRGKPAEAFQTQRHRLVARLRVPLLILWIIILCVDITLALMGLMHVQLVAGLILLVACIVYTIGIQLPIKARRTKEMQIALIFAGGVGLFFVGVPLGEGGSWQLAIGLTLFAVVCFINCVQIANWEIDKDRASAFSSLPLTMGLSDQRIRIVSILLGLIAMLAGIAFLPVFFLGAYLLLMPVLKLIDDIEDRRCVADGLLAITGLFGIILT